MTGPQRCVFVVWQKEIEPPEAETSDNSGEAIDNPALPRLTNQTVNPRYSFENFVVGASNRLAHAACMAVAENPARAYNPLFLYGGVGLGKTHLLHAIGNQAHSSGLQILYVSSEEFTNDLISAIRSHATQAFREKYRRIDVLLIDDIQFIAGKDRLRKSFFTPSIPCTARTSRSCCPPTARPRRWSTLEERLRSRFDWGLTVDIEPPDLETRIAILRSKAERAGKAGIRRYPRDDRPPGAVEHSRVRGRLDPRPGIL